MADNQDRKRVLILCTGNSARSQMAEGMLRSFGGDRFEVFSAGVEPSFVRPQAIAAMHELGIDISDHRSKSLNEFLDQRLDYVITVCDHANLQCPVFPATVERIHWNIDDPVGSGSEQDRMEAFRRARDELQKKISEFIEEKNP